MYVVRYSFLKSSISTLSAYLQYRLKSTAFNVIGTPSYNSKLDSPASVYSFRIGAIVGSMAEALWGVPKEISDKAFDLLPTDMLNVVGDFFGNLKRKQYV